MDNQTYIDGPSLMDYLYEKASIDYMEAKGPPDPMIRNKWINNHIHKNRTEMDAIVSSALTDMINNPRIDEIRSLISC